MLYDDMLSEIEEEDISDDTKAKRLQELHEFIKSHSHLHDDHSPEDHLSPATPEIKSNDSIETSEVGIN